MSKEKPNEEAKLLRHISDMLEMLVKDKFSKILEIELKDQEKRLLYNLTGKAKLRDIQKKTKFSAGKISGIWSEWSRKGLIKKEGKSYKKLFD